MLHVLFFIQYICLKYNGYCITLQKNMQMKRAISEITNAKQNRAEYCTTEK